MRLPLAIINGAPDKTLDSTREHSARAVLDL